MMLTVRHSRFFRLWLAILIFWSISFSAFQIRSASATVNSDYEAYVMGPLYNITNWSSFQNQLVTLKNNGVTAITTDVWWGYFERNANNSFDWSYYTTYANTVRNAGIKWVPILSFHQCGGNVGDDCRGYGSNGAIPVPGWLSGLSSEDQLWFRDEYNDNSNREYLSFWSGVDINQYDEAMQSFATAFSSYTDIIDSIHVGLGPAGELRYPSYQTGFTYPGRGRLQSYSNVAQQDFRNAMQTKYGTLAGLNAAWGTSLSNWSQISSPTDHDNFFINGRNTPYGQDYLNWYQGVMLKHMGDIIAKAHLRLDGLGKPLGGKIAGVHWQYFNPTMPHAAEYGAGYYNYDTIVQKFKDTNTELTFTCLEMTDNNSYPEYSAARTLVINVANLSKAKGVKVFGENALAIAGDVSKYQNSAQMLFNYGFSGFTLLRLANIVNGSGGAVINNGINELDAFRDLIALRPISITFTINNVATVAGDEVYVVGDRRELGMWDPYYYATKMNRISGTNNWTVSVYLGLNRSYNFKMVKKNGNTIIWEGGANKNYYTWLPGPNSSVTNWQN
jgi:beta-amylase